MDHKVFPTTVNINIYQLCVQKRCPRMKDLWSITTKTLAYNSHAISGVVQESGAPHNEIIKLNLLLIMF